MTLEPPRPAVLGRTTAELVDLAATLGQPAFRGRQLAEWLYRTGVRSFDAMTNLPAALPVAVRYKRWNI